jgi:hypothetical protein
VDEDEQRHVRFGQLADVPKTSQHADRIIALLDGDEEEEDEADA